MTSKIHVVLGGAAAVMALIAACGGNDGDGGDPPVETGAGGSAGSGGASPGGASGSGGNAGNTGGTSGSGGSSGDAGGTDAEGGSGGSVPAEGGPDASEVPCGNGALDELEQCDDNNAEPGDGCSSECTDEACDECRAESCSGPNGEQIGYLSCSGLPTSEDEALCEELLACVRRTGCASEPGGDLRACYCGSIDPLPCFASPTGTNADGLCKEEVIAAAKTDLPIQIGQLYFDANTQAPGVAGRPVGVVFYNLLCEQVRGAGDEPSGCREVCAEPPGDGGAGTGGSSGAGGSGGAAGTAGTGGTAGGSGSGGMPPDSGGAGDAGADPCAQCLASDCPTPLADKATQCAGGICDAYDTCLETTGCAAADVRTCYCGSVDFTVCFDVFSDPTVPQGPCKTQIEQLAGLTSPLQIGTRFFDPTNPLGAANQLILCTDNNCSGECP